MLGKEIDIWNSGDAMRNTVSLLFYLGFPPGKFTYESDIGGLSHVTNSTNYN
jgi:hypothetical protein